MTTGRAEGRTPAFRAPFDPSEFRRFLAVVLVGLGLPLHLVANPDEQRNLDEQATSQLGLLLDIAAVDRGSAWTSRSRCTEGKDLEDKFMTQCLFHPALPACPFPSARAAP